MQMQPYNVCGRWCVSEMHSITPVEFHKQTHYNTHDTHERAHWRTLVTLAPLNDGMTMTREVVVAVVPCKNQVLWTFGDLFSYFFYFFFSLEKRRKRECVNEWVSEWCLFCVLVYLRFSYNVVKWMCLDCVCVCVSERVSVRVTTKYSKQNFKTKTKAKTKHDWQLIIT